VLLAFPLEIKTRFSKPSFSTDSTFALVKIDTPFVLIRPFR